MCIVAFSKRGIRVVFDYTEQFNKALKLLNYLNIESLLIDNKNEYFDLRYNDYDLFLDFASQYLPEVNSFRNYQLNKFNKIVNCNHKPLVELKKYESLGIK